MSVECKHPSSKFILVSGSNKPGMFECTECQKVFDYDPSGQTSVKYLDEPNPNNTKVIIIPKSVSKG